MTAAADLYGRRPDHAPPVRATHSGLVPVRLDGRPDYGPIAGVTRWVGVCSFAHDYLCRALGLDAAFYYFDLPRSLVGESFAISGALSGDGRRRVQNGYVMYARYPEPVGKLTVLLGDRTGLRDDDPRDARDFLDLSRT